MPNDLVKKLIQDISCDPINSAAQSYMYICKRVDHWEERIGKLDANNPLVTAVKDAASKILKNPPGDGFRFDLQMIEGRSPF